MGIIQKISSKLYGKSAYQNFFEKLFYVSLKGMNYGNGSDYEKSGEKYIFTLLNKVFTNQKIIIFDVGANVGGYSKSIIENLKSDFTIHAFEPTSFCSAKLKEIKHPKFKPYQIGFSSQKGTAEINYDYDGSVWASIENTEYARHQKKLSKTETITLETIDSFLEENAISKVDFLKIDVEGHEVEAFKGAVKTLENNKISLIQFEFGLASLYAGNTLKDFFEILANYDIYRILQDDIRKVTYHEAFEIYLTTNYLAVNKNFKLKIL